MNDLPPLNSYPEISSQITTRTVKEMDPDQQPREKAEKYGCGVLSIPELWALILRVGTPGMPITDLCRNIMHDNDGSLHKLERRTRAELRKIKEHTGGSCHGVDQTILHGRDSDRGSHH